MAGPWDVQNPGHLDAILQILKQGHIEKDREKELHQRDVQLAQEKQQQVDLVAQRADEAKRWDKTFQENVKTSNIARKAAEADYELKLDTARRTKLNSIMKGEPSPDASISPISMSATGAGYSDASGRGNTGQMDVNVPGVAGFHQVVDDPTTHQKKLADLERLGLAPKQENAVALEKEKRDSTTLGNEQEFNQFAYGKSVDSMIAEEKRKSDEKIARLRNTTMVQVASMRKKDEADIDPREVQQIVEQLDNGDLTVKQLRAQNPGIEGAAKVRKIESAYTIAGGRSLSDEQQVSLGSFQTFGELAGYMHDYLDVEPKTDAGSIWGSTKARVGGKIEEYKQTEADRLQGLIESKSAEVSRYINSVKGTQSDKDVEQAVKGAVQKLGAGHNNNVNKADAFSDIVINKFNAAFHNLEPDHRARLMRKIGLDKLKHYKEPKYIVDPKSGKKANYSEFNSQQIKEMREKGMVIER